MEEKCVFCHIELEPSQRVVLQNEHCMFIQLEESIIKGSQLEGAGVIVPKNHRETAFDLTPEEWNATQSLLLEVKNYLDDNFQPQGYNLGWNCSSTGGQHISHSHFHVIPRFADETLAGKGIRYMFKSSINRRSGTVD
ncbi:HIT family protein [Paenibacillus sp. MBLB4367]|uniref:HIT family protein n=1 Tax=Paenibacillus sp. MBLB4367 TaxID=3384767 RepID=UPI0039083CED